MNESLAKQLHDLIMKSKWEMQDHNEKQFHNLDLNTKKLIESNQNQEKPNNT